MSRGPPRTTPSPTRPFQNPATCPQFLLRFLVQSLHVVIRISVSRYPSSLLSLSAAQLSRELHDSIIIPTSARARPLSLSPCCFLGEATPPIPIRPRHRSFLLNLSSVIPPHRPTAPPPHHPHVFILPRQGEARLLPPGRPELGLEP